MRVKTDILNKYLTYKAKRCACVTLYSYLECPVVKWFSSELLETRTSGHPSIGHSILPPGLHSDQLYKVACFWYLVQCTRVQYHTLDKSIFTTYQKNTALFIWSGCTKRNVYTSYNRKEETPYNKN